MSKKNKSGERYLGEGLEKKMEPNNDNAWIDQLFLQHKDLLDRTKAEVLKYTRKESEEEWLKKIKQLNEFIFEMAKEIMTEQGVDIEDKEEVAGFFEDALGEISNPKKPKRIEGLRIKLFEVSVKEQEAIEAEKNLAADKIISEVKSFLKIIEQEKILDPLLNYKVEELSSTLRVIQGIAEEAKRGFGKQNTKAIEIDFSKAKQEYEDYKNNLSAKKESIKKLIEEGGVYIKVFSGVTNDSRYDEGRESFVSAGDSYKNIINILDSALKKATSMISDDGYLTKNFKHYCKLLPFETIFQSISNAEKVFAVGPEFLNRIKQDKSSKDAEVLAAIEKMKQCQISPKNNPDAKFPDIIGVENGKGFIALDFSFSAIGENQYPPRWFASLDRDVAEIVHGESKLKFREEQIPSELKGQVYSLRYDMKYEKDDRISEIQEMISDEKIYNTDSSQEVIEIIKKAKVLYASIK
ncbi:MAG: hypothetical protein WAV31_06375 [Candidatus Moraniibacteriota bacterium]